MTNENKRDYDVIIIGGGPTGATAARCLAQAGRRVLVVEKSTFPRFHVGESFLPRGFELLQELGLGDRLAALPQVPKFGAEFGFGHGTDTTCFNFNESLHDESYEAFNIERAPFDKMLLDAAIDAGAKVQLASSVKRIVRLAEGDVAVDVEGEVVTGHYLFDATGQGTFLAKHLGIRCGMANHRKVAYYGHFENVQRLSGTDEGHPTVAMCDEGWFWMINIDQHRTSIGFVLDTDTAKTIDCPTSDMLFWGIDRCPLVRERLVSAHWPSTTHTIADFSYYCKPYADAGYFLIGDAAFFLDPIFSSGISIGIESAVKAATLVDELLGRPDDATHTNTQPTRTPTAIRQEYTRFIDDSAAPFIRLVNLFYNHSFRELFLHGQGPFDVQRAAISILSGYVFPKPRWSLRWRIWLLHQFARLQQFVPLVKRRDRFSLLNESPVNHRSVEPVRASA